MEILLYDLHTHTVYSKNNHGKGSIMENAKAANDAGLSMLGISDHGPGHAFYGLDMSKLPKIRSEIEEAKLAFPKLDIKLGVEANILSFNGNLDISKEDQSKFDYIMAGYHFGYFGSNLLSGMMVSLGNKIYSIGLGTTKGLRMHNTERVIAALEENSIKVLTHPGDKMDVDIDAIARVCERRDVIMEINSHHDGLSVEGIKTAMKYDVRFIVGSDAHKPCNVGNVKEAIQRAKDAGLELSRIINIKEQ